MTLTFALGNELADLSDRLRRFTVQVRGNREGGGSGIVWNSSGLVLTNAHVVSTLNATVELFDGRVLGATVVAKEPRLDLIALQVAAADLPTATVGDSTQLRVGELVLAVGHPLGMVGALTTGIVHAIGSVAAVGHQSWIQADIRLAPGNSGGPLANAQGAVIGMNSMIVEGLALAIPSQLIERFLRRPKERPFLGVTTQSVPIIQAGERRVGLLITKLDAGSPAEVAGLLPGDVLVSVHDRPFRRADDLLVVLRSATAGDRLSLQILRAGKLQEVEVLLWNQSTGMAAA